MQDSRTLPSWNWHVKSTITTLEPCVKMIQVNNKKTEWWMATFYNYKFSGVTEATQFAWISREILMQPFNPL